MLDDTEDLVILEGVLGLARAFRTRALAEGVETMAHGEMLLRLGCEWAQGYAIARAMPASDFPAWAAEWRTDPVWTQVITTPREDLPLLTAMVEHRAWVAQLQAFALGQREAPPPLHFHECPLGRWLVHPECDARHGHKPKFQVLNVLHERIHHTAVHILQRKQAGDVAEVEAGLTEIGQLKDQLVDALRSLLDDPS